MSLKIGIVGLPNVGKSTLFNALTRSKGAEAQNFPFCTIDPNVGIVEVPDERMRKLVELVNPQKSICAVTEFVDIAGLVKGASEGEGLGNKFLHNIRECDAIAQVIRFFEDSNVTHVHGGVNPKLDKDVIQLELILADLETVSRRLGEIEKKATTTNDKTLLAQVSILRLVKEALENEPIVRFEKYLLDNQVADEPGLEQIGEQIEQEIEEAVEKALAAPFPKPQDTLKDMFVESI